MTEPEIIKLKKEVSILTTLNKALKEENEENKIKIGRIEIENSMMKNENLALTRTNLPQQQELIRTKIEKALEEDKMKIKQLEKINANLLNSNKILEINLKGAEEDKLKLQKDNDSLKSQLAEFAKRNKVEDFLIDIQAHEKVAKQKEAEYQKLVLQWNDLCDKMEKVMSENSILREWANVPHNLGLPIEQIRIGEKKNIEYYKAALRRAEDEIRELEEERARLKNKLFILDSYHNSGETPFSVLTKEQQQAVCEYAIALHENREHVIPHQYELFRENEKLKTKIEILEKQLDSIRIDGGLIKYQRSTNIFESKKDREKNEKKDDDPNSKLIEDLTLNFKKEIQDIKLYIKDIGGMNQSKGFNTSTYVNPYNKDDKDMNNFTTFNQYQIPPIAMIEKDADSTNFGFSYRLNNKYRIDLNQLHALFGIAPLGGDQETLKIQSAHLMTQLIEALEIISRIKLQDKKLNITLGNCNQQFEGLVLKQNSLIDKFVLIKKEYQDKDKGTNFAISEFKQRIEELQKRNKALEECIKLIEGKNLSHIEKKVMEKLQENSVLELKLLQLTRKYSCLSEEHKKLKSFFDETELSNIDKNSQMQKTIIKLKEWKSILSHYLKLLLNKLKSSVDKTEYERVLIENRFMREKQHEMILRDVEITKKITSNDSIKLRLREIEQSLFNEQEMRIDSEIELTAVKRRLQEIDPLFGMQEALFRKIATMLSKLRIPLKEVEKLFMLEEKGYLTKIEFSKIITNLSSNPSLQGTSLAFSDKETDILVKFLDSEKKDDIDIGAFIRKLNRSAILSDVSKEETLLEEFIERIKKTGIPLQSLFEAFDTNGDGHINKTEFVFLLERLNFEDLNEELINRLILSICGENSDRVLDNKKLIINYTKFCELFDDKMKALNLTKKKNMLMKNSLNIDFKTNVMSSLLDKIKRQNIGVEDMFYSLTLQNTKDTLSLNDFKEYLKSARVEYKENELKEIFNELDKNKTGTKGTSLNTKSNLISEINQDIIIGFEEFASLIRECEKKLLLFKRLVNANEPENDEYINMNMDIIEEENDRDIYMATDTKRDAFIQNQNLMYNKRNSNFTLDKAYNKRNIREFKDDKSHYSNTSNIGMNKGKLKIERLVDQEKFLNFKLRQLKKELDQSQKISKENSALLDEYYKKNIDLSKKYSDAAEELSKLKIEYNLGVSRDDYRKMEQKCEDFERQNNIYKVGLNTFKDLYKTSCKQLEQVTLLTERHKDELETLKLAVKDLQSESDAKALMGKLYYSLLLSRWRESKTISKYDDTINDIVHLREENFKNETENEKNLKILCEQEIIIHDKIEEVIKLKDELDTYLNPIISPKQLEELKELVKTLSKEKSELFNLYFDVVAKLKPRELISLLDKIWGTFDQLSNIHGFQKIETVGYTYMGAGGLKECEKDMDENSLIKHHAIRAFELALDMIDVMSGIVLENGEKVKVKIGLHTGKVLAGVIGEHKPQFSLIGDTVNTAARMGAKVDKMCILVTEETFNIVKEEYQD